MNKEHQQAKIKELEADNKELKHKSEELDKQLKAANGLIKDYRELSEKLDKQLDSYKDVLQIAVDSVRDLGKKFQLVSKTKNQTQRTVLAEEGQQTAVEVVKRLKI